MDMSAQLTEVLQESTIAEKCGKDVESKFWVAHIKSSTEYDKGFLQQANDDMGVILTFAGIFLGVNIAFVAVVMRKSGSELRFEPEPSEPDRRSGPTFDMLSGPNVSLCSAFG
ncbi:hypothetical protein BDR07DRAFT_1421139 [Suillus spraguei]|nr:hypothetical protein BDR07DRAFT_1421139 [Suillus spraguei]